MTATAQPSPRSAAPRPPHDAATADDWQVLRRMLILGAVVVGALAFWQLSNIFLLLFGSILIAVLLHAVARPIARRTSLPQQVSVIIAALLILALLGMIVYLFGSQIRGQIDEIARQLPQAMQDVQTRLGIPDLSQRILREAQGATGTLLSNIANITLGIFTAFADLLLVVIGGVFLALAPRLYRDGVVRLFPHAQRQRVHDTLNYAGNALQYWLLGQLVSMAMVWTLFGVGLWLIGMPSPVGLGVIAGLTEFVPIVGPIIGAIPAVLLAFTQGWTMVLWVLGVFLAIQQLESNMIMPIVQRYATSLPPALTLFAVLAFGAMFGPLGLLFATPLAVVVYVAVKKLYVRDVLGDDTQIPGQPETRS